MEHLSNRQLQIGNVCIQWANLEYQLSSCIWMMAGLHTEVGKILTGGLDAKQRATAAFAIAHQVNAPVYLKTALKSVLTQLRERLIDERNRAIHGTHFPADQPDATMIEMHRGKGGRKRRLQTDAQLHKLGHDINKLSKKLNEVLGRYTHSLAAKKGAQLAASRAALDIFSKTSAAAAEGDTSSQSQ